MSIINTEDVNNVFKFGAINTFRYTNYKGETSMRRVIACTLVFGKFPHHDNDQWFIECWDLDKQQQRTFALANVHPR